MKADSKVLFYDLIFDAGSLKDKLIGECKCTILFGIEKE